MISQRDRDLASRLMVTTFGSASVGYQLGQMVANKRFPRAVAVFLDGDCTAGAGCNVLPGGDPPEVVVFDALAKLNWGDLWTRLVRDTAFVSEACEASLTLTDHHDWIAEAAKRLMVGPNVLWHAMCAEWVKRCMQSDEYIPVRQYIEDRLAEFR
jgi:hypothetical protein